MLIRMNDGQRNKEKPENCENNSIADHWRMHNLMCCGKYEFQSYWNWKMCMWATEIIAKTKSSSFSPLSLYLENLEHLFCPSHSPYTSILIFCIHSFQFSFRNYDYAERSLNFAVLRVIVVWFEISAHAHAIFTALVTNREPNWLFVSIESRSRCLSITCFNLCPIKNHCNSLKIFGLLLFAMNRVHIRSAHFMEVKVWFHAACNTADVRFVCSSTKRVARH